MEIRYKLTDSEMKTHNGFQWELNTWKKAEGKGMELCSEDFLHCYTDPLLAEILNPIHGNYSSPRLFKAEVKGKHKEDFGLKEGWKKMNLIEEMLLPEVSLTQQIAFGILCAKVTCKNTKWNKWADSWLSGEDRSKEAATAWAAAARAAEAAAWAAARAAEAAAWAAARAAEAAAEATAAWAAEARAEAARAAAGATTEKPLDLIALAKESLKY